MHVDKGDDEIVIIGMVTDKEEVKELEWSKKLSCFYTLIGEPLIQLASAIK